MMAARLRFPSSPTSPVCSAAHGPLSQDCVRRGFGSQRKRCTQHSPSDGMRSQEEAMSESRKPPPSGGEAVTSANEENSLPRPLRPRSFAALLMRGLPDPPCKRLLQTTRQGKCRSAVTVRSTTLHNNPRDELIFAEMMLDYVGTTLYRKAERTISYLFYVRDSPGHTSTKH